MTRCYRVGDPDRGDDRAEHADANRRGRCGPGHSGGSRGPVGGAAPIALPALGFGDHRVEAATDPQFGRVLEGQHHRDVTAGMTLRRNTLRGGDGAGGQPRRGHPRDQEAEREHDRRGGRDHRDRRDRGH